jgi:hypothetical protein
MDSSRRTPSRLRRVAMMAALAAVLAPVGQAEAAKKVAKPVVTRVAPTTLHIGDTLTIYGRNFRKGKGRNSVAFKRDGAAAVFLKSDVSTTRQIKVVLTDKLEKYLIVKDGAATVTTFRVRVLAKRFGKSFTPVSKSPKIGPALPKGAAVDPVKPADDGDCDGDDIKNGKDTDDDNDLLSDSLEVRIKTDQCKRDTDGDGVEDGYEFQSARDINDDLNGVPGGTLPYPEKMPFANPVVADGGQDTDGDGLSLLDEFRLWVGFGQHATSDGNPLNAVDTAQRLVLNYSDGKQVTVVTPTAGYVQQAQFLATAAAQGYDQGELLDFDAAVIPGISGGADYDAFWGPANNGWFAPDGGIADTERYYYDRNYDGTLSDDERDEDADGLPNWFEAHGSMQPGWWVHVYAKEKSFVVPYGGTDLAVADTDGDGLIDGADDQDHDDLPNVREIRRQLAAGEVHDGVLGYTRWVLGDNPDTIAWNRPREGTADAPASDTPWRGWVQPFNPCLPDPRSRTCEKYPNLGALYPPFDADAPAYNVFDGSDIMPE